jgi:hypothetical protein
MTFTLGLALGMMIGGTLGAGIMAFFCAVGQANHHYEN